MLRGLLLRVCVNSGLWFWGIKAVRSVGLGFDFLLVALLWYLKHYCTIWKVEVESVWTFWKARRVISENFRRKLIAWFLLESCSSWICLSGRNCCMEQSKQYLGSNISPLIKLSPFLYFFEIRVSTRYFSPFCMRGMSLNLNWPERFDWSYGYTCNYKKSITDFNKRSTQKEPGFV